MVLSAGRFLGFFLLGFLWVFCRVWCLLPSPFAALSDPPGGRGAPRRFLTYLHSAALSVFLRKKAKEKKTRPQKARTPPRWEVMGVWGEKGCCAEEGGGGSDPGKGQRGCRGGTWGGSEAPDVVQQQHELPPTQLVPVSHPNVPPTMALWLPNCPISPHCPFGVTLPPLGLFPLFLSFFFFPLLSSSPPPFFFNLLFLFPPLFSFFFFSLFSFPCFSPPPPPLFFFSLRSSIFKSRRGWKEGCV